MKTYEWTGIGLQSTIDLPLKPASRVADDPVVITVAPVPETIEKPQAVFPLFQARPGVLLLNIPEVGRFLVEDGGRITIEAYPEAEPPDIWTFLLGSALGAICHQRGLLPLHASAVQVEDGCIAFAGISGAGKSTIAAFLAARGYPLVADDLTVVSRNGAGTPVVRRGPPRVKLWKDGVEQLQADHTNLARVRGKLDKFDLPMRREEGEDEMPLKAFYLLEDGEMTKIEPLSGFAALDAVSENVYRPRFIEPLDRVFVCFQLCAAVAGSAQVARLTRPRGFEHLAAVFDELEAEWSRKRA